MRQNTFTRMCRLLEYHAGVRLGWRDPLIPPDWLHSVGRSDYKETGERFFKYFVDMGGLQPHEKVLDLGSGTGRMARPLTKYLRSGSYDGIDIVAPSVEWCRKTYAPHYPNFRFHHADIYNKAYNPAGRCRASEYRFPFESSLFDFIFLVSVFTHMLASDMENYLSEIVRALKPGGRCLITYFLLTPGSLKSIDEKTSSYDFRYEWPGCRIQDKDVPEAAVAYGEAEIRELYRRHRLEVCEPVHYGRWAGRKEGLSLQDIIVATKPVG